MPNWVYNQIDIDAKDSDISKIISEITDKDGDISFTKIMPPAETAVLDDLRLHEWRVNNWGTKWEPDECNQLSVFDNTAMYSFNTAWGSPLGAMRTLSRKYHIKVTCYYYDNDDFGNTCGMYELKSGRLTKSESHDYDHGGLDFIARCFGEDILEDYGYEQQEDGSWEYVE